MRTELSTEPLSHEPNRIARSPAPPGAGVVPWTLPPALPPTAEWQRYLAAALRFKWVVLGVTLACTALGVLGALLVKPSYVARATVWVQVPLRPARDEGPLWSGQLPISSGWIDLLQAYAVLADGWRSPLRHRTRRRGGSRRSSRSARIWTATSSAWRSAAPIPRSLPPR